MPTITRFTVVPRLPDRIEKLAQIADNLWWSWDHEAIELFNRVDRDLWLSTQHNPRALLGMVSQVRLEELAVDDSFLAHLERVAAKLDAYLAGDPWTARNSDVPKDFRVVYMSAEFGLHESVRIYSGGLGILAGDHLKAASDLGLPLVAVGLLYREGYFQQYLNADGYQQETYPRNDFHNMPISLARSEDGSPLLIEVEYPGRMIKAQIWKCQVGRVPLYLLDCDHPDNRPEDRAITAQLYGGDRETRIRQEIMLGMGGILALRALKVRPTTYHMNEGHSAFMTLQRIKELATQEKLSFDECIETVKAGSFFTTHTPVPAGNDMFDAGLIDRYFGKYCRDVGISLDHLLELGRQNPTDQREAFCMTVLALRLSAGANGVSKLHGEVARNMWAQTWRGVPEDEVPITSVTNGIHIRSFISPDLSDLYDRYLGPGWIDNPDDQSVWERLDQVPDTELWRTHERRRERLVDFARKRLYTQYKNRLAPASELRICNEVLDPEALTIGFARRFATYKRATLILKDKERLQRILLNTDRPVQFIIAGKAHPQDTAGKQLIRELFHFTHEADVRNNFIFIENYEMNVARYMVQGVDCWLNTPRRPMEASGTSGMKAAANGALNISIPDGWWCEALDLGPNGWTIGKGEQYDSTEEQDLVESQALYEMLEQEIVPAFYDRGRDDLPRQWIARMKAAIRTICPIFNTNRMVQEYADRCYVPSSVRRNELMAKSRERALALAAWKAKVRGAWPHVGVTRIESDAKEGLPVGEPLNVQAEVHLGALSTSDVTVEVFYGVLDLEGRLPAGKTVEMASAGNASDGKYRFTGAIPCDYSGELGFAVRILPNHPDLAQKHETGLITWG